MPIASWIALHKIAAANPTSTSSRSTKPLDYAAAGVNRSSTSDLATCACLPRHENLPFSHPTGVGKNHLANALSIEALQRGFRVFSRSAHRLLADLWAARANGTQRRVLAESGRQPLSPQGVQDLDELISERYERGSAVIISNRAF